MAITLDPNRQRSVGPVTHFASIADQIYIEFKRISYESARAAMAEGDYSYALRKTTDAALKVQLQELLAVQPRASEWSPALLPSGYGIFKQSVDIPRDRKIRVLVQMRDLPIEHSRAHFRNIKLSEKFDVKNVGFYADADIRLRAGMTLDEVQRKLGGWKPDFFYCHQVEYQCLPIGIDQAPYPVLGHVGDADLHWLNSREALGLFDLLTVVGSYDFWQLRSLTQTPVAVYPKIYGCTSAVLQHVPSRGRQFDWSFTGEATDPYRFDTQCFLKELSTVGEKIMILNGTSLAESDYFRLLRDTKLTPTYVRRWGAFSTRGLEAMFCGSAVLYQEGTEFGFYFSEQEGAIPYRPDNFVQVAEEALEHWPEVEKRANRGRQKAESEFLLHNVLEQYFEFLSFLAFGVDMERARSRRASDVGRRTPALMGGWGGVFADTPAQAARQMYQLNLPSESGSESDVQAAAARLKSQIVFKKVISLPTVLQDDMMACFNLARYLFHQFGPMNPGDKTAVPTVLQSLSDYYATILSKSREVEILFDRVTKLKALGDNLDCYDYLFCPEGFDYRGYLDILWRGSIRGQLLPEARQQASRLVRGYAWAYLFKIRRDVKCLWAALDEWESPNLALFPVHKIDGELERKIFTCGETRRILRLLHLIEEAVSKQPLRFAIRDGEVYRFLPIPMHDELRRLVPHFENGRYWLEAQERTRNERPSLRSNGAGSTDPKPNRNRLIENPADFRALALLGWQHYHRRQYSAAWVAFERSIELNPSPSNEAYLHRGWCALQMGRFQDALSNFNRFLENLERRDQDLQEAFRGRGWAHYHRGSYRASIDDFTEALRYTAPGDIAVLSHILEGRSRAYFRMKKWAVAVEDLRKLPRFEKKTTYQLIGHLAVHISGSNMKRWLKNTKSNMFERKP